MFRFYVLILLFSLPSLSFVDGYYEKGNYICEDFDEMKHLHEKYPDDVDFASGYAECLIVKGGKANEDKGLGILHNMVKRYNDIKSAFTIADYERTGGTFEKRDEVLAELLTDGEQEDLPEAGDDDPYGEQKALCRPYGTWDDRQKTCICRDKNKTWDGENLLCITKGKGRG